MSSGDHLGGEKKTPQAWLDPWSQKYPVVHRRPDYPLIGCVPAEPISVSPGDGKVTKKPGENQVKALLFWLAQ
jgi:hypothetical protein